MVSPPIFGIQNKIWPYAPLTLYDTILKEKNGYIAGVTNPVFLNNDKGYDLSCTIEKFGKIKLTKTYFEDLNRQGIQPDYVKIDNDFIKSIIFRI
jgi:hypothetical protein